MREGEIADNKNHGQRRVAQLVYYINVKSPNLDLKQGISYLERERGRDCKIEGEDRDTC